MQAQAASSHRAASVAAALNFMLHASWMSKMAFLQYALIGAAATATHYAVLVTLVDLMQFAPSIASGAGALVGAAISYGANRLLTFRSTSAPHHRAVLWFLLTAILAAGVSATIVGLGGAIGGLHYMAWQAIASLCVLFISYKLNKRWTFV